jgi:tetratricopeptide (TPR) repeat protein
MTFELPMRSGTVRSVIGLLALSVFGLLTYRAERSFFGEKLSTIPLFGTELAIQSRPNDAKYEFELGNYWLIGAQQPLTALPHFERATSLDPYNGHYWGQLALTSQQVGNVDRARDALARAFSVDPTTPELLWEEANVYSVLPDKEKSLDALRRFVLSSPDQAPIAAQLGWRTTRDARVLLDGVLPHGPDSDLGLLIALVRSADPSASARIQVLDDPKDLFVHNLVQLAAPEAKESTPEEPTLDLAAEREKARNKMLQLIGAKSGRDWLQTEAEIAARKQQLQNASYQEKQEKKRQAVEENADLYTAGDLVWKHLMAEREEFDLRLALPYIRMLVDTDQEAASIAAWNALVAREPRLQDWTQPNNLVRNGSFEHELLNGGLDWQYTA